MGAYCIEMGEIYAIRARKLILSWKINAKEQVAAILH